MLFGVKIYVLFGVEIYMLFCNIPLVIMGIHQPKTENNIYGIQVR